MAINFPSSPTNGDTYSYNGKTWTYDGTATKWVPEDAFSGVTATAAELNRNSVTTVGTVEASKVVTSDASNTVKFQDNGKAIFGAGSDLQIYHNGTNSVINDAGIGHLSLQSNGTKVNVYDTVNNQAMANFNTGGSVQLYHNGTQRLETTSTGINVTGEFVADSYNETYVAVTSTTNVTTVNCETGNTFSHILTEATTFTFSNPPVTGTAYIMSVEILQDAGATGYAVTWPSSVDWAGGTAPTLTSAASAVDVFAFSTRDGGVTWYGFTAALDLK